MNVSILALILFFALGPTAGCGLKKSSQGVAPNDATPKGTRLYRGTFFGMSGQTVSGTAVIYSKGGGVYTLSLQGITLPSESGLQADIYGSSQRVARLSLAPIIPSGGGTKNFSFSTSDANFTTVYIFSILNNRYYGSAQLY